MKKIFIFTTIISLLLFQGCAGGKWVKTSFTPVTTTLGGYEKNYTLGEKRTAFIGQEIIKVTVCHDRQKAFTSIQDIFADSKYDPFVNRPIKHNKIVNQYPIEGMVAVDNKKFYVTKGTDGRYTWGLLIWDDGSINKNVLYSYTYELLYFSDSIVITPCNLDYSTICNATISFELIFSGKNDVSLNTTYREYTANDLARPAFFQNLTYQPNAKQIRFKNFVIQIHSVTNEQITYTVLEDGLK